MGHCGRFSVASQTSTSKLTLCSHGQILRMPLGTYGTMEGVSGMATDTLHRATTRRYKVIFSRVTPHDTKCDCIKFSTICSYHPPHHLSSSLTWSLSQAYSIIHSYHWLKNVQFWKIDFLGIWKFVNALWRSILRCFTANNYLHANDIQSINLVHLSCDNEVYRMLKCKFPCTYALLQILHALFRIVIHAY